jgi:hypothetical protein
LIDSTDSISLHEKNIFADRDPDEETVTGEFRTTAFDGKRYRRKSKEES